MTRSAWRDGGRLRVAEVVPLGAGRYRVVVDGVTLELGVEPLGQGRLRITGERDAVVAQVTRTDGRRFVWLGTMDFVLDREARAVRARGKPAAAALDSPMPGLVTRVMVEAGDSVRTGQALLAVEAMKMEHLIRAPRDGRIRDVRARQGEMVAAGVPLVELDEAGTTEAGAP